MTGRIPRDEHPNPQWERNTWKNLNGTWDFAFDFGHSATSRKLWEKDTWDHTITVPFCPESELSGIAYKDFMNGVAYRRTFHLTEAETKEKVLLHFGAVDYLANVVVNGQPAGTHQGGYTSFTLDITDLVQEGENQLFVGVQDETQSSLQPTGKQALTYDSRGAWYTRTTGIWQTVWLEFVPQTHICTAKYYPDPNNGSVTIQGHVEGHGILTLTAKWEGKVVGQRILTVHDSTFSAELSLDEVHLWEPGLGGLYDLTLDFETDHVSSYFGLRTTRFEGRTYYLNEKPFFQRFVLDQGFYPDGIYTAGTDEELYRDIELSFAAGFNGARLHQKVFEPRFLYHCDRLGYPVWAEFPNWGLDHADPLATEIFMREWSEAMERDFNHPAIIGWCPFNETWGYFEAEEKNSLVSSIYHLTKRLDATRPCIDCSGPHGVCSEVYDIHDYEQDESVFKKLWDDFTSLIREKGVGDPSIAAFINERPYIRRDGATPFYGKPYGGQPIFISEYGGIRWPDDDGDGWGYGNAPKTAEEFFSRYQGLTEAMLFNSEICGFCYTQLYDIEQEVNGFYTYDRRPKFDINIVKKINEQKAAIEK